MKIQDLNEAYADIVPPLTIIAKNILDMDIYKTDIGYSYIRPDFSREWKEKFADKYGYEFYELMSYIRNMPIYIIDDPDSSFKGTYIHSASRHNSSMDRIELNMAKILPGEKINRLTVTDKKVRTTLVHELRHVMQRNGFGEYFHSDELMSKPYASSPIEIDASFVHLLHEEEADNIHDFVNNVMKKFSKYKRLTDKQYRHYRRQAASYFTNKDRVKEKPLSLDDRLKKKRQKDVENITNLLNSVDISSLRDLRNVGSTGERFLIDPEQFRNILTAVIRTKPELNINVTISMAFLGFMKKLEPSLPTAQILKTLPYTIEYLLAKVDDPVFKPWDQNLFKSAIKQLKE